MRGCCKAGIFSVQQVRISSTFFLHDKALLLGGMKGVWIHSDKVCVCVYKAELLTKDSERKQAVAFGITCFF